MLHLDTLGLRTALRYLAPGPDGGARGLGTTLCRMGHLPGLSAFRAPGLSLDRAESREQHRRRQSRRYRLHADPYPLGHANGAENCLRPTPHGCVTAALSSSVEGAVQRHNPVWRYPA
jgi:hypothetical protein